MIDVSSGGSSSAAFLAYRGVTAASLSWPEAHRDDEMEQPFVAIPVTVGAIGGEARGVPGGHRQ